MTFTGRKLSVWDKDCTPTAHVPNLHVSAQRLTQYAIVVDIPLGGDPHMEQTGMLVGNFGFNP